MPISGWDLFIFWILRVGFTYCFSTLEQTYVLSANTIYISYISYWKKQASLLHVRHYTHQNNSFTSYKRDVNTTCSIMSYYKETWTRVYRQCAPGARCKWEMVRAYALGTGFWQPVHKSGYFPPIRPIMGPIERKYT